MFTIGGFAEKAVHPPFTIAFWAVVGIHPGEQFLHKFGAGRPAVRLTGFCHQLETQVDRRQDGIMRVAIGMKLPEFSGELLEILENSLRTVFEFLLWISPSPSSTPFAARGVL